MKLKIELKWVDAIFSYRSQSTDGFVTQARQQQYPRIFFHYHIAIQAWSLTKAPEKNAFGRSV